MLTSRTAPSIELRPATDADQPFLQRLYASTRGTDLRLYGCDHITEAFLVGVQFKAQQSCYRKRYPDAELTVIVERERERPIGRLVVNYSEEEVRLVDISLLPEFRGKGLGRGLLRGLQGHGRHLKLPVRVSVVLGNPAQRLCQQCDFVLRETDGAYAHLEWLPSA